MPFASLCQQKKRGVYPKGTLRRVIVPTNNKKDKNFIVLFPAAKITKKCKCFYFISYNIYKYNTCILLKNAVLLLLWVIPTGTSFGRKINGVLQNVYFFKG